MFNHGAFQRVNVAAALVLGCVAAQVGFADTIDSDVTGPVLIGYGETVTVVAGGSVTASSDYTAGISAFTNASIRIIGGTVKTSGDYSFAVYPGGGSLELQSGLIQADGFFSYAIRTDGSGGIVAITGGQVVRNGTLGKVILAAGDTDITMSAGTLTQNATGDSTVLLANQSSMRFSGGLIEVNGGGSHGILAMGTSHLAMTGGQIQTSGNTSYQDSSGSRFFSTPTSGIVAWESSTVRFAGGTITTTGEYGLGIEAYGSSQVTITGGDIVTPVESFDLFAGENAVIRIAGQTDSFFVNGVAVDFGGASAVNLDSILPDFLGADAVSAVISGLYGNGEAFSFTVGNAAAVDLLSSLSVTANGTIQLVPSPATGIICIFLLGAAALRRHSRWSH